MLLETCLRETCGLVPFFSLFLQYLDGALGAGIRLLIVVFGFCYKGFGFNDSFLSSLMADSPLVGCLGRVKVFLQSSITSLFLSVYVCVWLYGFL